MATCSNSQPIRSSSRQVTDPGGPLDFNNDGTVGILDLLALLANWGACQ